MAQAERKIQSRRMRRLALAAIGLISLNCASPALGLNTTNGDLVFSNSGLSIGGVSVLPSNATLDGDTTYIFNGNIKNSNTAADSTIDVTDAVSTVVLDGNITGNNTKALIIKNDKATFVADEADVTGIVNFEDTNLGGSGTASTFILKSIGNASKATVTADGGTDGIILEVTDSFGAAGNSSLDLTNKTKASVTNIGAASSANNVITIGSDSTLDVTDIVQGALTATNKNTTKNTFTVNALGASGGASTDLTLDGRMDVKELVGKVSIQTKGVPANATSVELDADGDSTNGRLNLGKTSASLELTLDSDDDTTPVQWDFNFGDKIIGGTTAANATAINIDTTNVALNSVDNGGASVKANVEGNVKINLIGDSANDLELGELVNGAVLSVENVSGANDKAVIFDTANTGKGAVSVVNKSGYDNAVIIDKLSAGILNVGGGGAANTPPLKNSVFVNELDLAANDVLTIGSVANDYGRVAVKANGLVPAADVTIKLTNAVLQVSDAALDLGSAGKFEMDSTAGDSRLTSEETIQFTTKAPTVTVGPGGDVIIETKELKYGALLATGQGEGLIDFSTDTTNSHKMIFASSDNTNTFSGGAQVEGGRFEFKGATDILAKNTDYVKNSDIYFTGTAATTDVNTDGLINAADNPLSNFTVSGAEIDVKDSVLHLNNKIDLTYAPAASLGGTTDKTLAAVMLGDRAADSVITFGGGGTDTILKAAHINTGYYSGAQMAAAVDNVYIGKLDAVPTHPDGSTAITFTNGLQGTDITLNDQVQVTGGLYIDKNAAGLPVIKIGRAEGGFLLTDAAATNNSYIESGSVVELLDEAFQETKDAGLNKITSIQLLAGTTQATKDFIANTLQPNKNFAFASQLGDDVWAEFTPDGELYYTKLPKTAPTDVVPVPKFAQPMLTALDQAAAIETNSLGPLAAYMNNTTGSFTNSDAYNRELTMVMGNTMNSSLSLIHNGVAHAFGHLNSSVPTLAGYETARAVSAPPRRQAPAPAQNLPPVAPSPAIGVPYRATDAPPPVSLQPQPAQPLAPSSGSVENRPSGLWIAPHYASMSADGNYKEGYGDFDVKGMSMVMGFDQWVNENGRLGAFMSVSRPKLESDNQDIEADDLQFGVYAQGIMPNGVIVNGALAFGRQDYTSTRDLKFSGIDGYDQQLKADYNGKTISAAMELSRPVLLENDAYLRPSLGYSYQSVQLDDLKENSSIVAGRSLAQKISSNTFNIQQVRMGTDIGWVNPDNTVSVNGRAFLVANVGDTQPEGKAAFISGGPNAMPFKVRGGELDDTMANLGLGLKFTPAGSEGLIISLDYDALLGSKTQSHSLGLMLRYEF